MTTCPVTGTPGRPVEAATVRSLQREPEQSTSNAPWFYCGSVKCDTVYFTEAGDRIEASALNVRVGEKEQDPPHTVCYCFGHTRESIEEEFTRTGQTTVVASIAAR